ncbi:MAG: sugar ABC transporter substrate-binding protein, partial [Chroococcidiopsidaceae cyanobacterium CP_BM_RX_35]|nr:sugar ABC transporter substrate-binding protein [Chroococcidiopsidaceae cyanobacterium CP_BM_RX_35]
MKVLNRYLVRVSVLVLLVLGILTLEGCQFLPARSVKSAGITKVTLWQGVNPPSNRDMLQKLVDQFNREHPEIQVESLYVGQSDQQMPKILAAVVGNAPPDLLWFNPTITGQLVELDAIRPLEDWLAHSTVPLPEIDEAKSVALPTDLESNSRSQAAVPSAPGGSSFENIDPTLIESMEYQGHTWSVPFGTNNVGVFYRPSLFEAAGIAELPKTWDELRQVARKLTRDLNGDKQIDQHGILLPLGKGEFTVFLWLPFMWSGGGELVNTKASEAGARSNIPSYNVANQGAIAALQFWHNLIEDGSAILSLPERGYEIDAFLKGKVAMQLTGPWTLGQFQATAVDFGVFPIP